MNFPKWVEPGISGAVIGAVAIVIVGFSEMGWVTGDAADRMAWDRADFSVMMALLPFCVANAERDPDVAKLAKLKAE